MKELSRVLVMTALVVAFVLATSAWVGATFSSDAPAPQHLQSATPGPHPMPGSQP